MSEYESKWFSVWQFFETDGDEWHECVRSRVSAEEAVKAFHIYTNNPASKLGFVKRVIVVDDGDVCNMEWKFGEGITFPKNLVQKH